MKTLEELQKEEQELRKFLIANSKAQREISEKEFIETHGINIGDDITWSEKGKLYKGKFIAFDYSGNKVWAIYANKFNANGQPSKSRTRLYSQEMKTIKKV